MRKLLVVLVFCLIPFVAIAGEVHLSDEAKNIPEHSVPFQDERSAEWEVKYLEARNQILQLQAEIFQGAAQKEFSENLKRIEELKGQQKPR